MKSQDIGLLLKLSILQKYGAPGDDGGRRVRKAWPDGWQDWETEAGNEAWIQLDYVGPLKDEALNQILTVRGLSHQTGISKTQVSLSLKRCVEIGLAKFSRKDDLPMANTRRLLEFIAYGLRYVFPASPKELTRGIGTSYAAPVLAGQLMSAGEFDPVWADPEGNRKGLRVEPLYKGAIYAAKIDPHMYAALALVDAIRMGNPREANFAMKILEDRIG
jgi:hypothetical protein